MLVTKADATINQIQEGKISQPANGKVCQYTKLTANDDNRGPKITAGTANPYRPSTVKMVFHVSPKAK